MSTVRIPTKQRFVLFSEPWSAYTGLLKLFDERRHVRITYDRGILEVVTLTHEHEHQAALLGGWLSPGRRNVGLPSNPANRRHSADETRSAGWNRTNVSGSPMKLLVRDKEPLDLRHDPPPDLVIEIDVTHSSRAAYAHLRISRSAGSLADKQERHFL